ncbi:ornithine cyclodeaminase family protein [Neptunomonas antarctica]|uniref:Ornithine cyclodeaminase n=1 Tax=Neptunomonas antarctica TaxID=619304 RepID=A0A1N7IXI8_9GAMM|nr:ornithine cyclodeaminase family protein [Neptunomonas antarctica]SIS41805.1 ornithine cyclodeaminase [Neptunomonas antarctica]
MLVIEALDVQKTLSFIPLVAALRTAFSNDFGMPQRHVYHLPAVGDNASPQNDSFAVLPAWNDQVMGVKAFTHLPGNPAKGLETLASKMMLFSRPTGEPLAVVDGTQLTFWRTAAVSALAADYLAKKDAKSLLLFGTGKLAPYMALAHASVRPLKTIYVTGRTPEKIAATVAYIQAQRPDLQVQAVSDPESVIGQVDIISCATGASEPLFSYEQVSAGTHIDLVGNHSRDRRECDSKTVQQARVFVDSRLNVLNEAGELLFPIAEGVFSAEQVQGELADLCHGRIAGRSPGDAGLAEITLFKSVGTALSDLAAAYLVYQQLS